MEFCKHIAKATQANTKSKLWQRACKSEPEEFLNFSLSRRRNKISESGLINKKSLFVFLDNLLVTRQINKALPITRTV